MSVEEVLKAVFPKLDGVDLASCMLVCKRWRVMALDDYFWKCLCFKKWPSLCKKPNPPSVTYYKLYQTFYKRQHYRTLPPARLSFDDLEFFVDIWSENNLIFSEVAPAPVLLGGIKNPPLGISSVLRCHLENAEYKLILPIEPRFRIPLGQILTVSVFVGRKDTNKVARVIDKSAFDYIDRSSYRALAFDYLDFSATNPFVPNIRAWVSLLFMEDGNNADDMDVFGIELDFRDAANTREEVLWLLDILDWK